jgi:hypothetical protein
MADYARNTTFGHDTRDNGRSFIPLQTHSTPPPEFTDILHTRPGYVTIEKLTTSTIRTLVGDYPRAMAGDLYPIFCLQNAYSTTDGKTIPKYSVGYCYPPQCDVPGTTDHSWGMYIDGTSSSPNWVPYANWFLSGTKDKWSYMQSGRLGIGTTTPQFGLDVLEEADEANHSTYWNTSTHSPIGDGTVFGIQGDGNIVGSDYGQGRIGDLDPTTQSGTRITTVGYPISIHSKKAIYISSGCLYISSDERIKEKIVDVSDNIALEMVRNIPTRYYEYKDKRSRGTQKTIGFIAQEVKEVLPIAVGKQTQFIPNEMKKLNNITWNDTILTTDLQDVSGVKYRFYVSNDISGNNEVMKEVVGNSDNTFTFDISYNNVFCYGKEVNDFHTLDKQKLFALNFSATQELDRKVIVLENDNAELKTEVATLKSELAAIKQHLGI